MMTVTSTTGHAPSLALRALAVASCVAWFGGAAQAEDETPTDGETTESTEPTETDEATEPAEAVPDVDFDAMVRVVQQRPVLKKNRFELLTGAGLVLNDDMYDHWLATASGRFHISEWISVGASYSKYFSSESDLQSTIATDYEVYPELSAFQWHAGADVSLVAVEGKFVAFDDLIAYWDFYAMLGGGVMVTSRSESPKPAGLLGVGFRLFLGEWLTFSVELRDHMFFEDFRAGHEFINNLVGQAGLTFFIPFGFDYEYAK